MVLVIGRLEGDALATVYSSAYNTVLAAYGRDASDGAAETARGVARTAVLDFVDLVENELQGRDRRG